MMAGTAVSNLWPDSPVYTYYHVLAAFHPRYNLTYCLHIASVFINLVNLIPFYCYVFRKTSSLMGFWRFMFVVRIISEVVGHDYEYKLIRSLFFSNTLLALATLLLYTLILVPSYFAVFQFTFYRPKVPGK